MRVLTDMTVEAGDHPNRRYSPRGHHCIELATGGPLLLLEFLADDEQRLHYLQAVARECLLLAGQIERDLARRP